MPGHRYRASSSLLDTHGTMLAPWEKPSHAHAHAHGGRRHEEHSPVAEPEVAPPPPAGAPPPPEYQGWQNLAFVLLVYYVATNTAARLAGDASAAALEPLWPAPAVLGRLALDWVVLSSFFLVFTFPFQWGVTHGVWPLRHPAVALAVQAAAELTFFGGCVLHAVRRPEWPLLQRMSWLALVTVLVAKMHSYIVVNRHLAAEVAAGGSGTGWCAEPPPAAAAPSAAADVTAAEAAAPPPPPASGSSGAAGGSATSAALHAVAARVSRALDEEVMGGGKGGGAAPGALQAAAVEAAAASGLASGATTPLVGGSAGSGGGDNSSRGGSGTDDPAWAAEPASSMTAAEGVPTRPVSTLRVRARSGSRARAAAAAGGGGGALLLSATPSPPADEGGAASPPAAAKPTLPAPESPMDAVRRRAVAARVLLRHALLGDGAVNAEGQPLATGTVAYPRNVTPADFFAFFCAPTLCYEPNYPRTPRVRLGYVAEKLLLGAGLLTGMAHVRAAHVAPTLAALQCGGLHPLAAVGRLVLPLTAFGVMGFFLVFEAVLNAAAEVRAGGGGRREGKSGSRARRLSSILHFLPSCTLRRYAPPHLVQVTRFGDRTFYEAYWNASTFAEFSRQWNVPVHVFLLRHVRGRRVVGRWRKRRPATPRVQEPGRCHTHPSS